MIRKIIEIDKENATAAACAPTPATRALSAWWTAKATLLRDDYCDGLGNCLPVCPTGAISFVEREAAAYDEAAVQANMQAKSQPHTGCPGSMAREYGTRPGQSAGLVHSDAEPAAPVAGADQARAGECALF